MESKYNEQSPVVVIGALNLDMNGIAKGDLRMHDSNPGRVVLTPGGVGHNISRHLAKAGFDVELISILGDDYAANILSRYCSAEGIGLGFSTRYPGPSSTYLSIQTESGEMAVAINDMSLMDAFAPSYLQRHLDMICAAPLVCADANLPQETLEWLARECKAPLLLDPVSGFKAERARHVIRYFTAIKPNALEAEVITGTREPARAADWFLAQGVRQVYISQGAEGVYWADANGSGQIPAPAMQVDNTSGAGDAMSAGIGIGMLRGLDTAGCATLGVQTVTTYLQKQGGILL